MSSYFVSAVYLEEKFLYCLSFFESCDKSRGPLLKLQAQDGLNSRQNTHVCHLLSKQIPEGWLVSVLRCPIVLVTNEPSW